MYVVCIAVCKSEEDSSNSVTRSEEEEVIKTLSCAVLCVDCNGSVYG